MNKKGSLFFGITLGIFIFVIGALFIPFFADDITTSRTQLDCTNMSITDGTKLACLQVDLLIPYIIWFFVSLALGLIMGANT